MIEHELAKRTVQARHLPTHERESRARNGYTSFKIKAKGGADIRVIAGFEIKIARFAPTGNFDILAKFHLDDGVDIGHFVGEKVQTIPDIVDTHTILTFKAF